MSGRAVLFDEVKIDTKKINGELYVSVEQLWQHLTGSAEQFSLETAELAEKTGLITEEKYFIMGMIQGMMSVVSMLRLAQEESVFGEVDTIEDLLQKFKENDAS